MDLSRQLESTGPWHRFPTTAEYRAAKTIHDAYRAERGRGPAALLDGHNAKLEKGTEPIVGLSLYPGTITRELLAKFGLEVGLEGPPDRVTVCRWATASCDPGRGGGCLGTSSGRNVAPYSHRGKLLRTLFAVDHPREFVILVIEETRRAAKRGKRVRLNVTSDLQWHKIAPVLFVKRPTRGRIYDYTKDHRRVVDGWHLTYSASERHDAGAVRAIVESGRNVSVVLDLQRGAAMPASWYGLPLIDGDEHDNRWSDPLGVVVGLRAKDNGRTGLSSQTVGIRRFVKPVA